MRAHVRLRTPDGVLHDLAHGDIIGRLGTAALHLDDPRVSEAHALVSLRGGELQLLALRGRFALAAGPLSELTLVAGQRIRFARDLALEVVEVVLPEEVLALEGDGLPRQMLTGAMSLVLDPRPALVPGYREGAAALLWNRDAAWRVRVAGGTARDLLPGDVFAAGGVSFRAVAVALARAGQDATSAAGLVGAPLTIICHYDSVQLHREDADVVAIGGVSARLLSELAAFGAPVEWETLAREIWGEEPDRLSLRRRFDTAVSRLRRKLAAAGIRPELVHNDGGGRLLLLLGASDRLEDRG